MTEKTINNVEQIIQDTAKSEIKKLKQVKFFDKKLDAIGATLANNNDLLQELTNTDKLLSDDLTNVAMNQRTIVDGTETLLTHWDKMRVAQATEQNTLSSIYQELKTLVEIEDNYDLDIHKQLETNKETYDDQLEYFEGSLQTLRMQIVSMDVKKDLHDVQDTIDGLRNEMVQTQIQQMNHFTDMTNKVKAITSLVKLMNQTAIAYEQAAITLEGKIDNMNSAINKIDNRLSSLTPKEFNHEREDILTMFESFDEYQVEDYDNPAEDIEAEEKQEYEDIHPTDDQVEDSSDKADETEESSETPEIETTITLPKVDENKTPTRQETHKKKSLWHFWKY